MATHPEVMTMGVAKAPAGILGNASQSQINHVVSRIGNANERVLGVWAADEDAASKQAWAMVKGMAVVPCFWPHLILGLPCWIGCGVHAEKMINHSVYFITDKGFGTAVVDYDGCCSPGNDYTYSPWDQAISVNVDNVGCWSCMTSPSVVIAKHGFHVTGTGDDRRVRQNGLQWFVGNPDEVAAIVRQKMAEYKDRSTNVVLQVPAVQGTPAVGQPPAGPAGVRVFVAFATTPGDRRIAILNPSGSFDEMANALSIALGAPTAGMPINLAPAGQPPMAVTTPSMVRADDMILVG